jgi:hypothetical protein
MVYVIYIVVQGLWITWEHYLSRFECWGSCGNHLNLPKWFSLKFTKYLFPLVKELPVFEYKWVNVNLYSSISCEDKILENLLDFYRKFWIPLKFKEDSNSNLFQKLQLAILWEFEVVPKRKVVPCVSNYPYEIFGEIWTLGRSPIWISNCGCLKILLNKKCWVHLSVSGVT